MKNLLIADEGYVWSVPVDYIAMQRANYYATNDRDTTFEDEFNFVMEDSFEAIDWFLNNMNWSDVAAVARLVQTPKEKIEPSPRTWFVTLDEP
jgi:hypothetical protein